MHCASDLIQPFEIIGSTQCRNHHFVLKKGLFFMILASALDIFHDRGVVVI